MRAATGAEVEGLVKFLGACGVHGAVVEPFVDGDNLIAFVGGLKFTVPLEDVERGAPALAPVQEAEPEEPVDEGCDETEPVKKADPEPPGAAEGEDPIEE